MQPVLGGLAQVLQPAGGQGCCQQGSPADVEYAILQRDSPRQDRPGHSSGDLHVWHKKGRPQLFRKRYGEGNEASSLTDYYLASPQKTRGYIVWVPFHLGCQGEESLRRKGVAQETVGPQESSYHGRGTAPQAPPERHLVVAEELQRGQGDTHLRGQPFHGPIHQVVPAS